MRQIYHYIGVFFILACCLTLPAHAYDPEDQIDLAFFRFVYTNNNSATQMNQAEKNAVASYFPQLTVRQIPVKCYHCNARDWLNVTYTPGLSPSSLPWSYHLLVQYDVIIVVSAFRDNVTAEPPIIPSNELLLFQHTFTLHEAGNYTLLMQDGQEQDEIIVQLIVDNDGHNIYLPIVQVAGEIAGALIVIQLLLYLSSASGRAWLSSLYARIVHDGPLPTPVNAAEEYVAIRADDAVSSPSSSKPVKERLQSLDVMRGLTLCIMLWANAGGGGYVFFNHTEWAGENIADVVFAWFIWMMGVSMALSLDKSIRLAHNSGDTKAKLSLLYKIVRRSAILYALGVLTENNESSDTDPAWNYDVEVTGVLMRFGVCYFLVGVIMLIFPRRDVSRDQSDDGALSFLHGYEYQHISIVIMLVVWLAVTLGMAVEGCPRGYMGPGGRSEYGAHALCTGGIARTIDLKILTDGRMVHYPTCFAMYDSLSFEPEGVLGYLTSSVLVYIGVIVGRILSHHKSSIGRLVRIISVASILGSIVLILTKGGHDNDTWIPVVKNLWSPSYIFANAALGCLVLSFLYIVVDVKKWYAGWPLLAMGMNSIVIFVGSEVCWDNFPFVFAPYRDPDTLVQDPRTHMFLLHMHATSVSCWVAIANYMHAQNFILLCEMNAVVHCKFVTMSFSLSW